MIRPIDASSSTISAATSPSVVKTTTTTTTSQRQHSETTESQHNQSTEEEYCSSSYDHTSTHDHQRYNSSIILEWILANDFKSLDSESLMNSISILKERGAHRCWHKHSTFLDHLLGVHNILRLWGQGPIMGRVGLFHSAYSNSYVNLALFSPISERFIMQSLIGTTAEELVYLFCIINRQDVVVNHLLKIGYIPSDGLYTPHLKHPHEQVYLSTETMRNLLIFSMADIAEQYFGWQDDLFGGSPGSMLLPGLDHIENHNTHTMWPGISKPGLWMTYVNQLGLVANTYPHDNSQTTTFVIPPVFDNCTKVLTMENEIKARDLYWDVTLNANTMSRDEIIKKLVECHQYNPWIFEPLVLLSQQYLYGNEFDKAEHVSEHALLLQQQWGTSWDKRLPFGAWVAWTRVMHQRSIAQQPWPTNSWDINNFGLVQ